MRSVLTALEVVESVARWQPIGLSALALKLGVPKTTVQRCLTTLAEAGWLERSGRGQWAVGSKAFIVTSTAEHRIGFRDIGFSSLVRLAEETGETVYLSIRDDDEVVLVERVDGTRAPATHVPATRTRTVLHRCGHGRAVMALLTEADLEQYMHTHRSAAADPLLEDREQLRRELADVRSRGFVITGDAETSVSIAAPIKGGPGRPLGSVSVVAPVSRVPSGLQARYGALARRAADRISTELHFRGT